ncbi:type I-C CRISPR-associated protein Cas8c/Csd1 [Streptomonospora sp. S1-112]|uniref:Type I-C CRISPR-associated protein Cas8c/Csd1 n=1 Tax=Streptomonospora mangrovi TaxID=2883123 RepID=A0A9X3NQG2_9ACTN|nr:type I-C CRISPR-associated protein Cas8c/Csd1 [Streptomonospora mangrovi]MDA0568012.1 type I-C CRISPR-associated protein Cas8c/Csd1 [Streptomonospora mangrovi]
MLLKALADHAPHVADLPPAHYRPRTVRWCLTIDTHGRPQGTDEQGRPVLNDLADADRRAGVVLNAPYVYRSGAKPPPTLLVDTLEYVLGVPKEESEKAVQEALRRNTAYIDLLSVWAERAGADAAARAVRVFFTRGLHRATVLPEGAKPSDLVALSVVGHPWPHLAPAAQQTWRATVAARKSGRAGTGRCLSCNQDRPLLDSLPEPVKAGLIPVPTGRGRDAQLVSVNTSAQGRGGRIQLADIPLCEACGAGSTAVLNALLADHSHRYRMPDSVLVWWLKEPLDLGLMDTLLNAEPSDVAAVFAELERPRRGSGAAGVEANRFYTATLAANQSRVVVREWIDIALPQALERVAAWFGDHQIADWRGDQPRPVPVWLLARCLGRGTATAQGWRYTKDTEPDDAHRRLLHAALHHTAPPLALLSHLNQRIGADGRVDHPRAALLRLFYNRAFATDNERVPPVLDENRTDPAYVAGRLFAVLESLQYRALRDPDTGQGPNSTIADKVLSSAKSTPRARMEPLLDKSQAHLRRLRTSGAPKDRAAHHAYFRTICELHDLLEHPLPEVLDQQGQSLFSLGYYQQHSHDQRQRRTHANANANGEGTDQEDQP